MRRLLGLLLGVVGLMVAALIVVTTLQLHGSHSESNAESRRTQSFLLADSMRQSSNDLTNMVRLYVATGDSRYRDYYNEILAIRSGLAPRPLNYNSSFWDRVLAQGTGFVRYGPRESLVDLMRRAHFTPDEFRALDASLRASNGLAQLELAVMNRVARRISRGVDAAYLGDVRAEYDRLVDRNYLAQKGTIMAAVTRFIDLVQARTRRAVNDIHHSNNTLFAVQLAILALLVLVGLAALVVVSRVAVQPLGRLADATRRIASGDYAERADIHGVAELAQVAGAFNEMAGAIQTDIDRRERAEQDAVQARHAAEQASGAKSSFLAAMSHEIRTPMIGVTGMLEVLARTELSSPQRHMVATAESSAHSLLQIIGDVLDFSKIEASKLELAPVALDLRALVNAVAETFRHTASAKGLLLASSVDERLAPALVGDALRLRQILANFLSNAVKFTTVGGIEVAVSVLEESGEAQTVEVSVTDTGVGVPEEQQRQLFSDFVQADAATAQRFGGSGLGLAICRRLATLMGGDVRMESAPGRGTTMRLVVPLAIGDPADADPLAVGPVVRTAATRPKPTREQAVREGSLLLIAEDHAVNRTVLRHQLDIVGFAADFADDGVQALERYLEGGHALVLTDLNMPRMDGYELTHAIRRHEAEVGAPRIPILALSANVMQGEPERCRAAGMDDFAAKPTTIPFLAAKLRQWLPDLVWQPETAAPEQATPDDAPIDANWLAELTGGDLELAATLVSEFIESTRNDFAALDESVVARDPEQVRRHAHRMKGASQIVGAHRLTEIAKELEHRAMDGVSDWDRLRALVTEAGAQLDAFEHSSSAQTEGLKVNASAVTGSKVVP